MASADPMLVEEYNKYVFEMEEQGLQPISFKAFVQQIMSGMAEGGIARLGYASGQLVKSGPGRPGYQGDRWDDPGMSPGTSRSQGPAGGATMGGGGGGGAGGAAAVVAAAKQQAAAEAAEAQARAQRPSIMNEDPKQIEREVDALQDRVKKMGQDFPNLISTAKDYVNLDKYMSDEGHYPNKSESLLSPEPFYDPMQLGPGVYNQPIVTADEGYVDTPTDINLMEDEKLKRIALGIEPGYRPQDEMPYGRPMHEVDIKKGIEPVLTLDRGLDITDTTGGTGTGGTGTGGTGGGGTGITSVPIDTAAATTDAADPFAEAKEAAIAEAAKRSLPFEHYYVGGDPTAEQEKFMREHQAAASMVGKEAWPAAEGGMARQRYGLGSIVKKAFKAVKKIAKSPVGKAALIGALGFGIPGTGFSGILGAGKGAAFKKFLIGKGGWLPTAGKAMPGPGAMFSPKGGDTGLLGKLLLRGGADKWSMANLSPMKGIGWLSMLPFLTQKGEDEPSWAGNYGEGLDIPGIRKEALAGGVDRWKYPFLQQSQYAAQGGRIGYQDGRSVRSLALNQLYGIMPKRKFAQEGGLMDMGGMEKDYRQEGGFVPIGGQERADDVPARLSKNEFVFTADAVRAAGGGDIDKGAEVMENVMENLERGGQVSEESQGLEGARNMFATAQRLEGVL
jgi:hypothetical protein